MKVLLYPQESTSRAIFCVDHFSRKKAFTHLSVSISQAQFECVLPYNPGWIIECWMLANRHISYTQIATISIVQKKLPLSFRTLNEIFPFISTLSIVVRLRRLGTLYAEFELTQWILSLYENWWFRVSAQLCIHLFCNRLLRFFTLFNFRTTHSSKKNFGVEIT